jgi:hypothetical protein
MAPRVFRFLAGKRHGAGSTPGGYSSRNRRFGQDFDCSAHVDAVRRVVKLREQRPDGRAESGLVGLAPPHLVVET